MPKWSRAFRVRRQAASDKAGYTIDLEASWQAFLTSVVGDPERARLIHEKSKRQPKLKVHATRLPRVRRPKGLTRRGDFRPRVLTYPRSDVIGSPEMTRAEIDVFTLLAAGLHSTSAAKKLGRSPHTVARQVQTTMRRFGVTTACEATARAIRSGQVLPPPT